MIIITKEANILILILFLNFFKDENKIKRFLALAASLANKKFHFMISKNTYVCFAPLEVNRYEYHYLEAYFAVQCS